MAVVDLPFDLGRQCRLVLVDPDGNDVQLDKVTGFDAKENTKKVTVDPLNSRPETIHIPMHWDGTFELSRRGPALDILFANRAEAFWNGAPQKWFTMFQYISEQDGSETSWQWNKVSIGYADAGSYKATDDVKQRIEFSATSRTQMTS